MSRLKETPCEYYICKGECKKGRKAEQYKYCQHCDKYKPRAKVKYENKKKEFVEREKGKIDYE